MAGYEYMGAGAYRRYVGEEISETGEQKADMKKKIEASKPGDKK